MAKLSIGAVARATGVPANTLRTWERRYGFPRSSRTAGGHRTFDPSVVDHVRLVQEALSRGHRAAQVLVLPVHELADLLHTSSDTPEPDAAHPWLPAVLALDGPALDRALAKDLARLGAVRFLLDRAEPFVRIVGAEWARGGLAVHQEHFASERLEHFLVDVRGRLARSGGPRALLATPPGERHVLGLHMAALAFALGGWEVLFVGAEAPIEDLAQAASEARAVALSISVHADAAASHAAVASLQALLPPHCTLVLGGRGAPELPGCAYPSLESLARGELPAP